MKILLVAATNQETESIKRDLALLNNIECEVHGVGILSSCFRLYELTENKPELIIQCGIAGSYRDDLQVGETVIVSSDSFETGAEEMNLLHTVFDLGFMEKNDFPFTDAALPCPHLNQFSFSYKKVKALTVAVTSGTSDTIQKRINKYNPDIETMEGAALHYVCLKKNIPFLQLRTISNKVEVRNKDNWNIPLALQNNKTELMNLLSTFK